jgi:hypothetical protein
MSRTGRVQLVVIVLLAAADCSFGRTTVSPPKAAVGRGSSHATIQYVSKQFGFSFALPADWRGYTIVMDEWSGEGNMADVKSPILSIWHPHWTEEKPRQDLVRLIHARASIRSSNRVLIGPSMGIRRNFTCTRREFIHDKPVNVGPV